MTRPPTPLLYFGGKTWAANWIVSQMPPHFSYREIFAGMLGVLLAKSPGKGPELVNDSNQWLVNWWKCVRDRGGELAQAASLTPRSRVLFEEACKRVQGAGNRKASGIQDALDFSIIIQQGLLHGWGRQSGSWAREGWRPRHPSGIARRIEACAARLANVEIECRDAIDLVPTGKGQDPTRDYHPTNTLVYCDPPYYSADTGPYGDFEFDKDAFTEAVLQSPSLIMISGYPAEWDHLGWRCETRTFSRSGHINDPKPECLWMNFPPVQGRLL